VLYIAYNKALYTYFFDIPDKYEWYVYPSNDSGESGLTVVANAAAENSNKLQYIYIYKGELNSAISSMAANIFIMNLVHEVHMKK